VHDPDLLRAADRNFIGSFEKLVEHQAAGSVRWFGPVFAFVSRIPVSIFNGLVVLEPADPAEVDAAAAWVREAAVPSHAWLREGIGAEVAQRLVARGYELRPWIEPVMAIRPPSELPRPREGVSVRPVEDDAGLEEHIRHMIAAGLPEPKVRLMYVPAFAFDPDVRIFTAYLDGWPMGHAIAIRTGASSGVYAVGTRTEARRRGVGDGCHLGRRRRRTRMGVSAGRAPVIGDGPLGLRGDGLILIRGGWPSR